MPAQTFLDISVFQSTPSAWRETVGKSIMEVMELFQSTPSAWRETNPVAGFLQGFEISIHSLRMEGDIPRWELDTISRKFQSTPSAWRETLFFMFFLLENNISIHSLRMEGDLLAHSYIPRRQKFQSTPSAWRETTYLTTSSPSSLFQSTPSAWRETTDWMQGLPSILFQSTPSAWRETIGVEKFNREHKYFNPLPPHGGRRLVILLKISLISYFNPLPPHGGRLSDKYVSLDQFSFQSTPSAWRETYSTG